MKEKYNPYFELFRGNQAFLSHIIQKVPFTLPAVEILSHEGRIVGQYCFGLTKKKEDLLLWMPEKMKRLEAPRSVVMSCAWCIQPGEEVPLPEGKTYSHGICKDHGEELKR